MTQPKFPWALLAIIAMFTFVAVTAPPKATWIVVLAIVAVLISAAAAIYQVIPRRDDSLVDLATDPDSVPEQWSGEDQS
ncbi:MAG TPA: hypothetical protein VMZ66_11270 [Aeromicrobium sp.]|nr:hypothetical protein [Aeromicrobium sp.]